MKRYGDNTPSTHDNNSAGVPIDGILGYLSMQLERAGYWGFREHFDSDHYTLWCIFRTEDIL